MIYTLPISFMLIYNTMCYIDKKYMVVSRIMGDSPLTTFTATVLRPLSGTFAASFIQAFFLSFTDFGIPAAVGGEFEVVASVLYSQMLGSVPNFNNGAVVAMVMLVPSVVSIAVLQYLERYNVRYNKISTVEIRPGAGAGLMFRAGEPCDLRLRAVHLRGDLRDPLCGGLALQPEAQPG